MTLDQDLQSPLAVIEEVRRSLGDTHASSCHFALDLAWLEDRERIWAEQKLRVAVVGITSSGKSSLVNALLGQQILPRAVRPSSNTLVLCRWGEALQGKIIFLDADRPTEMVEGGGLSERLQFFADEERNPGNREGVKEIVIESPEYRLAKDIIIVDTPGLDAYGFVEHEKLTLDVLMPTVDVVLFVTTCKANADARIAEYLGKAVEYGRPVIVAQNMIDSIVAKLDHRGEVLSSWADVAQGHARRMQRLMESQEVSSGSLVQVSSLWALNGRLQDSRVLQLVGMIGRHVDELGEVVARGRLRQLQVWLDGLVSKERLAGDVAGLHRECRTELDVLLRFGADADGRYDELRDKADMVLADLNRQADGLLRAFRALRAGHVDDAQHAVEAMMKWLWHSPTHPARLWQELQKVFESDCERLNLRLEDVDFTRPGLHLAPPATFETVERTEIGRTAQNGFWGGLKRSIDIFGSDWGFDESVSRWTEISDLPAFTTRMTDAVDSGLRQLDRFLWLLKSRALKCRDAVWRAKLKQETAIEMRMRSLADAETRLRIAERLASVAEGLRGVAANGSAGGIHINHAIDDTKWEMAARPAVVSLVRLAKLIAMQRFLALRDDRLSRVGPVAARRILIAGFDRGGLDDLVARYWFDVTDGPIERDNPLRTAGNGIGTDEIVLVPIGDSRAEASASLVKDYCASSATVFFLVDAHQIGSTHSQFARCRSSMPELFGPNIRTILVIQSVRELLGADQVAAGLLALRDMIGKFGLSAHGVLVNDDCAVFSELADTLVLDRRPMVTLSDEVVWLSARKLDEQDKSVATGILREWRASVAGRQNRVGA